MTDLIVVSRNFANARNYQLTQHVYIYIYLYMFLCSNYCTVWNAASYISKALRRSIYPPSCKKTGPSVTLNEAVSTENYWSKTDLQLHMYNTMIVAHGLYILLPRLSSSLHAFATSGSVRASSTEACLMVQYRTLHTLYPFFELRWFLAVV